jgi:hypothetical protein
MVKDTVLSFLGVHLVCERFVHRNVIRHQAFRPWLSNWPAKLLVCWNLEILLPTLLSVLFIFMTNVLLATCRACLFNNVSDAFSQVGSLNLSQTLHTKEWKDLCCDNRVVVFVFRSLSCWEFQVHHTDQEALMIFPEADYWRLLCPACFPLPVVISN